MRPLPGFIELDHQTNFDFTETLKVRYMAEGISTKLEKSFRKNGKRMPVTVNITLPAEGEDQKDNGETKAILGFIGTGLNDLTPQSS